MRPAETGGAALVGGAHPVVQSRRLRELGLIALAGVVPVLLGLAISIATPHPSVALLIGLAVGGLAIVFLFVNKRLEVSVAILALYLGMLDGPIKLGTGAGASASVVRDVLIFTVALGALLRLQAVSDRIRLPPLSAWVLAWAALALAEGLNPRTAGLSKALAGYRSQLEWLPFFFFGYALIRSRERFRRLFLVLGVIALANGVVGSYQAGLGVPQLASWGAGYRQLVQGNEEGKGARVSVKGGGEAQVRPPALGGDAGFGGGVAVVALPATLALLVAGGVRRRWPVLLLTLGALAAVTTGLGRLQVVGAVISMVVFVALAFTLGGRINRALAVILGVIVFAIPVGAVLVTALGGNTFSRYSSLVPGQLGTSSKDTKTNDLAQIPKEIGQSPFGVGLGRLGAGAGFGGKVKEEALEKQVIGGEEVFSFELAEMGLPGLLLWVALTIRLAVLMAGGLRRVADPEIRLYLAAIVSTFVAFTIMGFSGPTMQSAAFGPFFWGAAGICAYWFVTMPRRRAAEAPASTLETVRV